MDYIPYTHQIFFWFLFPITAAIFLSSIFFGNASDRAGRAGNEAKQMRLVKTCYTVMTVGALSVLIAGVAGLWASTAATAEWNKTVASSLSSYYGIAVTSEDLYDLDYPRSDPEKRVYLGTAKLATGEGMDEFAEVTLGINNGKVYLLEQDGATYTELEPAATR
jgi:hypothetical protein